MHFNDRDEIIALTPKWKGERLEDGRPKVDKKYLLALKNLTLEEVWKPIFVKGYESQFEGIFYQNHDFLLKVYPFQCGKEKQYELFR